MIIITDKSSCCGCSSCAQRCPKQCISLYEDNEGFLYPHVDTSTCIDCGICEKVCPCLNQSDSNTPLSAVVFSNSDSDVIMKSSSGGAFAQLAEYVLSKGGVVFGAKFNEQWDVVHDYTEAREGLKAFRGSKYMQSVIGNSYCKAEDLLKAGREVLFSGTPCQISGLRKFLRKDYSNLLAVEIVCHSVSSSLVWREYLRGLRICDITGINFRDKRRGWAHYGLSITNGKGSVYFQEHDRNPYMQLFLNGITARPSCFNCPSKNGRSVADITLGDCWGIAQMIPNYPDVQKGVSFVLCNSEKGLRITQASGVSGKSLSYKAIVASNGGLTVNTKIPKERSSFWASFHSGENKAKVINQFAKPYLPSIMLRFKVFVSRMLNRK